jgi:hypothetical protein
MRILQEVKRNDFDRSILFCPRPDFKKSDDFEQPKYFNSVFADRMRGKSERAALMYEIFGNGRFCAIFAAIELTQDTLIQQISSGWRTSLVSLPASKAL